jgi:hypothetical protein
MVKILRYGVPHVQADDGWVSVDTLCSVLKGAASVEQIQHVERNCMSILISNQHDRMILFQTILKRAK